MNKSEQALIDKIYANRFKFSHEFMITLADLLRDEFQRRIDEITNSFFSERCKDEISDV